jgi:hypothetical protein
VSANGSFLVNVTRETSLGRYVYSGLMSNAGCRIISAMKRFASTD